MPRPKTDGQVELVVGGRPLILPPCRQEALRDRVFNQLDITEHYMPMWFTQNAHRFVLACAVEALKLPPDTNPNSIKVACFNCASLGLLPGSTLGHAFFVPFRINRGKPNESVECTLIPGYKGYVELTAKNDFITGMSTELVLKDDTYERWNDAHGPQLKHAMALGRRETWENVLAAYCLFQTRGGFCGIEVVQKAELQRLKTKQKNVWDSDPLPMSRKTPVRRAAKLWQLTRELAMAVELDDQADRPNVMPQAELQRYEYREDTDKPVMLEAAAFSPEEKRFDGDTSIAGSYEEFAACGTLTEIRMVLARRVTEIPSKWSQAKIEDATEWLRSLAEEREKELA